MCYIRRFDAIDSYTHVAGLVIARSGMSLDGVEVRVQVDGA